MSSHLDILKTHTIMLYSSRTDTFAAFNNSNINSLILKVLTHVETEQLDAVLLHERELKELRTFKN